MIIVSEKDDRGRRRVSIDFNQDEKVILRKSNNRKVKYEFFPSRSKAKPEFHKDMNINKIMARFDKTKVVDPLILRDMKYGDFANGASFSDSFMKITDANYDFMQLPADVRSRFQNDPAQLLDFLADKANYDEAVKLNLVEAKQAPPPPPAPTPIPSPTTPPKPGVAVVPPVPTPST